MDSLIFLLIYEYVLKLRYHVGTSVEKVQTIPHRQQATARQLFD